jgi:pimeloyl-ACP methyl ester carboxylesterase
MQRIALMCAFTLALGATAGPALASHSTLAVAEQTGISNAAAYAMFVPGKWNGSLVLYAHGFVDVAYPVALPDVSPPDVAPWVVGLRETLLGKGYAVAYSSYAENGWAVGDGSERTHELRSLFSHRFGVPDRVYLIGRSLGALIALLLAEQRPSDYQGALALCGPVGGGRVQTDYIGHVRVLYDFFFPGVIPGDAVHVPELDYSPDSPLVNAIVGSILTNPHAAVALASVDQIELPYTSSEQLIASIVRPLGYNVRGTNDLLARTGSQSPFGNVRTSYSGLATFDQTLNAGVDRFKAESGGIAYLEDFYRPTGNLEIPILTLHTTADPDVPFSHEAALTKIVSSTRKSKWLAQEHIRRYGHCNFSPAEVAKSLSRLVEWAEKRVKPAGGDVTP